MKKADTISQNFIPPCQDACPVKTRARDYVRAVAMGQLEKAYEIITENNPFPSVCGRVCMHPCEEACRRNDTDEPVSIANLKRYASDYVNENDLFMDLTLITKSKKKVAIVGAGPSGLAAAVKLVEEGHEVEVFESNKKAGGLLRYGIPNYRLSDEALDEDIKRITAKGVKINTNKAVGKDISLDELRENYDATLVSVGLSESRTLPIEGIDAEGVHLATDFLRACNSKDKPKVGKNILVIGGGNVAVDVARNARRLDSGAKVIMACLESNDEMPASLWEIEEAKEEKIEVKNCMGPRKVKVKDGKVTGMHFITCALVFDNKGRFNPTFVDDEKHFLKVDTIIVTIGQQANLDFLPADFVNKGRLVFDSDTLSVTDDGVFTCGEVSKGPGSAIAAIANGNLAAKIINQYLAKQVIDLEEERREVIPELGSYAKKVHKKDRQLTDKVNAEKRIKNFDEFDKGFSKRTATKEALRCMDCGDGAQVEQEKCVACLTCVRVCPFDVATIDKNTSIATMPIKGCQACGACAAECPADAIDIAAYPLAEQLENVEAALKNNTAGNIGFICQTGKDLDYPNSRLIRVKCPIRLSERTYLKAFELGAKKVFVTCHKPESCRYIKGPEYAKRKVGYVKQILDNMGVKGREIKVFQKSQKEEILAFNKTEGEKILSTKS